LDQTIARLRQRHLLFADADSQCAWLLQTFHDYQAAEEMRLARTTATKCCLVPRWLQQRSIDRCYFEPENGQRSPLRCAQTFPRQFYFSLKHSSRASWPVPRWHGFYPTL